MSRVIGDLSDDAIQALKNSPHLDDAMDGLARVIDEGINPKLISDALNNPNIFGSAYKQADLLMDLDVLAVGQVEGLASALKLLKSTNRGAAQTLGFRYEIEGAAFLARGGHEVVEITSRIAPPIPAEELARLGATTSRTDIDVVVREGQELVFYQFKRTPGSLNSLPDVKRWVEKAKAQLDASDYSQIVYALPNGISDVTPKIKDWFTDTSINIRVISVPTAN